MTIDPLSRDAEAGAGTSAGEHGARFTTRAKLILAVLCAAQFIISLDFSILNVALPDLGRDLGMEQADLQWAVTAFALPSGGCLLLFGRMADLYGRRRLFLGGVLLFTVASVVAALAWNPGVFVAGRVLQGLGAAAVVPTGMSLLTTTFAEGPQRNRALGVSGSVLSLGFTVGMLVGGAMTDTLGWRSTMALLAVAGGVLAVAAPGLLTESRGARAPRLDLPGAATVSGGLVCLIYALSAAGAVRAVAMAAAVLLLGGFVVIESRAAQPLVSLTMLRRPTVAFGSLGGLVTFSMMSSFIFLLTLYLQDVVALSPLWTGLFFGGQGVVLAVTGMVSSSVIRVLGAGRTLVAGLALQGVCTAAMTVTEGAWPALAVICLASVGHMSVVVSYGVTVTSGLPDTAQGLATGLVTSAQQIGITVGTPILSAICMAHVSALRAAGQAPAPALLSGVRLAAAVDAGVVLAGSLVIGYALLRATSRRPRRTHA
ncbi:MFS transporter [Nonomuraea sp. NPDC001636]|uniref:MFS transporter n=1 Tax=Nonomuraea sp. NPDC001636 TaxID=3154391 RepID=UPI0033207BFF